MSDQPQGPGWWQASDGRWYPPQQPRGAPTYQQPAKSGNGWLIAVLVAAGLGVLIMIVVVIAVARTVGDAVDETADDAVDAVSSDLERQFAEAEDVELAACETDEFGNLVARLEVTNTSSGLSDYLIEVVFETPNGQRRLGTSTATVNELRPGQSTDVLATTRTAPTGGFVCDIVGVDRLAS